MHFVRSLAGAIVGIAITVGCQTGEQRAATVTASFGELDLRMRLKNARMDVKNDELDNENAVREHKRPDKKRLEVDQAWVANCERAQDIESRLDSLKTATNRTAATGEIDELKASGYSAFHEADQQMQSAPGPSVPSDAINTYVSRKLDRVSSMATTIAARQ